jgi:glycosyltransferase involved in cell wall biosynthesis
MARTFQNNLVQRILMFVERSLDILSGKTMNNLYYNNSTYTCSAQYTRSGVSIVIPTLNEAKNLPHVLSRLPNFVEEVIIVDGHSEDDTVKIAKNLLPNVRVIFQKNSGKGDALRCAFNHVQGEVIVQMDADGSMAPEEVPRFVEALRKGADVVKGSRFIAGGDSYDMTTLRRVGNALMTAVVNILYSSEYTDLCYGFAAFNKQAIQKLIPILESDNFEIETEIFIKAKKLGLSVVEVPSIEFKRKSGKSNLNSFVDGYRILKTILASALWADN